MQDTKEKSSEPQPAAERRFGQAFPEFTQEEIARLTGYLTLRHFTKGEVVWKQNDPSEYLGFLVSGALVVKREGRFPGKNIILAMLETGSLFGEMAVAATTGQHSVTLSAAEEAEAYVLSADKAGQLFDQEPLLSIKLLKKIIVVCGLRLQHTGLRLVELL